MLQKLKINSKKLFAKSDANLEDFFLNENHNINRIKVVFCHKGEEKKQRKRKLSFFMVPT